MAATYEAGYSYLSVRPNDWQREGDYSKWAVPFPTLPLRYAPLDKQMRVVVDGVEYKLNDGTDPGLTHSWTYTDAVETPTGIPCWAVRLNMVSGPGNSVGSREIVLFDQDGNWIPVDPDWVQGLNTNGMFDGDGTTTGFATVNSNGEASVLIEFPFPVSISKVGWTRLTPPASNDNTITSMEVILNVGTPGVPEWRTVASVTGLTVSDYPTPSTPFDPNQHTYQLEIHPSLLGGVLPPVITIDPPPAKLSDRVTIFRETRQDRPWVGPTDNGLAIGRSLHWYWMQLLYIYQEVCELEELAPLVDFEVAAMQRNDYTSGNQMQFTTGGSPATTFSWDTVELLSGIPGAPSDPKHQLLVQRGNATDGTSTAWTTLSYLDSPTNANQYSIDPVAKTITLGDTTTFDIRIRRVTRKDRLWADIEQVDPIGWNSAIVLLNQRQIQFLGEEACYLPQFYTESLLSNPIFPRAWNWLIFADGGGVFTFGGPSWGGDGSIVVYDNDVLLTEGEDYIINFPNITFPNGPPSGPVSIGIGGGGFGGFSFPDGEEENEEPSTSLPNPSGGPTIDWPGLDLGTEWEIDISIGSARIEDLKAGNWEAGVGISGFWGNGFHLIRVQATVTKGGVIPMPGGTSFYPAGAKEVLYCLTEVCPDWHVPKAIAAAGDPDGGGFSLFDAETPALGCLEPTGARTSVRIIDGWISNDPTILGSDPPQLKFLKQLFNMNDVGGDMSQVPLFNKWQELTQMSVNAAEAGVVSQSGFTWDQFKEFLDPEGDFDDFDIPLPPP